MTTPLENGRKVQREVFLTAICCMLPATPFWSRPSWRVWVFGSLSALLYANLFEYWYHRWPMHTPDSKLFRRHLNHHATVGTPWEMEQATFGGESVLPTVLLFVFNIIPFLIVDFFMRWWISPVALTSFVAYFIVLEWIHFHIHLGTWKHLGSAHHLQHHDQPSGNFNVWLPLWDFVFGTKR